MKKEGYLNKTKVGLHCFSEAILNELKQCKR